MTHPSVLCPQCGNLFAQGDGAWGATGSLVCKACGAAHDTAERARAKAGARRLRAVSIARWGCFGLLGLGAIVPAGIALLSAVTREAPAQRRALLATGQAELRRVEAMERERNAKLAAAAVPTDDLPACAEAPAIAEPPMIQGGDLESQLWRTYLRDLEGADAPFELRGPGTMPGVSDPPRGPRLRALATTVATIESLLGQGSVEVELPALPPASAWRRDVTIIVDEYAHPRMLPSGREFESGRARGRAFLYEYERAEVTCAGRFEATNTDAFVATFRNEFGTKHTNDLASDLRARIIVQGVRSLRALPGGQ